MADCGGKLGSRFAPYTMGVRCERVCFPVRSFRGLVQRDRFRIVKQVVQNWFDEKPVCQKLPGKHRAPFWVSFWTVVQSSFAQESCRFIPVVMENTAGEN